MFSLDVTILTAIIVALAALVAPLLPKLMELKQQKKKERRARIVTVKRMRNLDHRDVDVALQLYDRRILAETQKDSPEDIIRWLREVENETKMGMCKLEDFFLIARIEDKVAGFAYVQFYPDFSLAFFSYLVVDDEMRQAREGHVSRKLLEEVKNQLFKGRIHCKGVVVEMDDPSILQGKQKTDAAARIRHFQYLSRMLGFTLKTLSISYAT